MWNSYLHGSWNIKRRSIWWKGWFMVSRYHLIWVAYRISSFWRQYKVRVEVEYWQRCFLISSRCSSFINLYWLIKATSNIRCRSQNKMGVVLRSPIH
jgi:hypothetical protein